MNYYIIITAEWAAQMQGKKVGPNVFFAVQTSDLRWVVSSNALNDFPEHFAAYQSAGNPITLVTLTSADFNNGN